MPWTEILLYAFLVFIAAKSFCILAVYVIKNFRVLAIYIIREKL